MPPSQKIKFQEVSSTATEFLHELSDPDLLRNRRIPPAAAIELRKQQVLKLQQNIVVLVGKREEFSRRMTEYIHNLEKLVRSLENGISTDGEQAGESQTLASTGTKVRCLNCETERNFRKLQIIFARESAESMATPTEVYVLEGGSLKKGHFACRACGTESLVIQSSL
jgi:hypothetical protein